MNKTSIMSNKELEEYLEKYLNLHKKKMEGKYSRVYTGVIYARLSEKEINNLKKKKRTVSSSITSQVVMLLRTAENLGVLITRIFVDDGYSGQRFDNRPGFNQMIKFIELGQANFVMTKNISRLGRDIRITLDYFQEYFPKKRHKIRS